MNKLYLTLGILTAVVLVYGVYKLANHDKHENPLFQQKSSSINIISVLFYIVASILLFLLVFFALDAWT